MSLFNQKFNFLTIISEPIFFYHKKQKLWKVECLCDCGNKKTVRLDYLKKGLTKSCGCYNKKLATERITKISKTHGLKKHPLYSKWRSIKNRCYNKKSKLYLNDKIIVCNEWINNFQNFYDWAINNGWKKGLQLHRRDINSNYDLNNCYFDNKRSTEEYKQISQKSQQTCLRKYKKRFPLQIKDFQNKAKKTWVKKYGVDNPLKNKEIRQKQVKTLLEKYGTIMPPCNLKEQKQVQDWLLSLGFEFKSNCQILKGKEIDLYNENLKLGIEYCGLYWHTEGSKTPRKRLYHYDKYKECLKQEIRLITIFSDEWTNRQDQLKNYIKSVLGIFNQRIYARKCDIAKVEYKIARKFIDDYHIQGCALKSMVYIGIFYQNELLGILSLKQHHRQGQGNIIILDRLCFKDGFQIIGGVSKMFKRAVEWSKEKKYDKIITWSDNRYSQGNAYKKLGLELTQELGPDYSYVKLDDQKEKRYSKQSQKKSNTKCPPEITERDWAIQHGLWRIWDCGKKRFEYKLN